MISYSHIINNEPYRIAAYCRISVDDELNKENTSIENQKSIISDYVFRSFPNAKVDYFIDRDRSGYTFSQREGYQILRRKLFSNQYDILIVKDLSRFSRRNGAGLVELESLRDEGIRIIAIGDNIDYPTNDDWLRIQIYFLMNEMPVTDTSKKVRSVINQRQRQGKWICSVPYGYVIVNSRTMEFEVDPAEAVIIQKVFDLYNSGWGYKRIANYLTGLGVPTPRMDERARKEARSEECHIKVKTTWSIATIQGILTNDFYTGTLRQGKYKRIKINGKDVKTDENTHIVFPDNHQAIIDSSIFTTTQDIMKKRSTNHYRGVKKYANTYSGLIVCGDCGSPMFPMSRSDIKEAYRCGEYHKHGRKACTSHHIRVEELDLLIKDYLHKLRNSCEEMIRQIQDDILKKYGYNGYELSSVEQVREMINDAIVERKALIRQRARDMSLNSSKDNHIQEAYDELIMECNLRIDGLENQIKMIEDRNSKISKATRTKEYAIAVFDDLIEQDKLSKSDIELLVDKVYVYEGYVYIKLKSNINGIL